jgi:hypothetical protein
MALHTGGISGRHFARLCLVLVVAICPMGCGTKTPRDKRMSNSAGQSSEATARFHRIVSEGDLDALRSALADGVDVNVAGRVGHTALMLALESKDLDKAKLLIENGADPEQTDDFNHTALRHAVDADFADGVRYLLSLGVDRGYHPKYPLKKIDYGDVLVRVEMPENLKGILSESEWEESLEQTRSSMQEMGQNPAVEPIISAVLSVEVLKLFLDAGDDLSLAHTEVKRALVGLNTGGELTVTPGDYQRHKLPRFGRSNPERMDFPFWQDMIRTGGSAYSARTRYNDSEPLEKREAIWCFDRFGSSLTPLGDGRFVQIAGEHEDHYDPDFYIYNDIVIHDRGNFQIYGYPREVFPPTDFHTATLCADGIYIIGCLGYPEQRRQGFTPVYRVMPESWKIKPIKTTGEMPGWIHRHQAQYDPDGATIRISGGELHVVGEDGEPDLVPNQDQFELDLARLEWKRLK